MRNRARRVRRRRPQQPGADAAARRTRPPLRTPEQQRPGLQQHLGLAHRAPVRDQHPALVAVALPRRTPLPVQVRRQRIEHPPKVAPIRLAQRRARRIRLDRGHQEQLAGEAVVLGRELTVEPVGEALPGDVALQQRRRQRRPGSAGREHRKRPARRQQPRHLGDHVVIGRRPAAMERRDPVLVRMQLHLELRAAFERILDPRVAPQQPPHKAPVQQPQAHLDAADPMDPPQRRVRLEPRPQMLQRAPGVTAVAGAAVSGREHRQMMQPRDLPHRLDVPDQALVAIRHLEPRRVRRRPPAGHRVEEPVRCRPRQIGRGAEHRPLPPVQQGIGALQQLPGRRRGGTARRSTAAGPSRRRRGRAPPAPVPRMPQPLQGDVAGAPSHLADAHAAQPLQPPSQAGRQAHG